MAGQDVVALKITVDDQGTLKVDKFRKGSVESFKKVQGQADSSAKKTGKSWAGVGKVFNKITKLAIGMGAAFAGIGVALAVKGAIQFESAFAGVKKTVTGTAAELGALRDGIRDMAKEIPASTTAIAGVAEAAGQLGIKTDSILDFTRVMIDLGETTNLSADEAATSLARLANITQMPQENFERLGSTVVELGNNLATTEAEIVEMGLRLAGAGDAIGLTEAQILSFAGALSSVGIRAEAGGTAFSKIMLEIDKAAAMGGEAIQGFADIAAQSGKVAAEDFASAWETDAAEALTVFIEGLQAMEKANINTTLAMEDLGLKGIRVGDALRRTSGAGDLVRKSLELGTKAWEENTALAKEAEERYKTLASQLGVLKNQISDVLMTLGEQFMPALRTTVKDLREFIKEASESGALDELGDRVRELGETFVSTTRFVIEHGGALVDLAKLAGAVFVTAKIASWATAIQAAMAGATLAIAGPGAILVGLGLLAAALQLVFDKWEQADMADMKETIDGSKRFTEGLPKMKAVADQMGISVGVLTERYGSYAEMVKESVLPSGAALRAAMERAARGVEDTAEAVTVLSGVVGNAKDRLSVLTTYLGDLQAAGKGATAEAKEVEAAIRELTKTTGPAADGMKEYADEVGKATAALLEQAGIIPDLKLSQDSLTAAFERTLDIWNETGAVAPLEAMAAQLVELAEKAELSGQKLEDPFLTALIQAKTVLAEMAAIDALEPILRPLRDIQDVLDDMPGDDDYDMDNFAFDPETPKKINAGTDALIAMGDSFLFLASSMGVSGEGFGNFIGGLTSTISTIKGAVGSIKQGWTDAASGFSQMTAGGGFMSTLTGAMGMAGGVGSMVSAGIGLGISVFKGLKKIFGGKEEWEKVGDLVQKNLGVALSEGTSKAIAQLSKDKDISLELASLLSLDQIIAEADIGADNLGKFANEAAKLFDVVAQGGETGEMAMQALNDSYGQLINSAIEADATWTVGFANLIDNARASGIEIEAVMQFVGEAMADAADGLNKMTASVIDSADRFTDLGSIAAAVFDGLVYSSGSFLEAVQTLGPSLDNLAKAQGKLGATTDESTGRLLQIRAVVVANEELFTSLEGLVQVTRGLGEAGFFTADAWAAVQREAVGHFNAIQEAGLSQADSLTAMAPVLQELVNEHLRRGKAIDAETMAMIEQASQMGLIDDHGTGLELTFLRVGQAIVDTMGKAFGIEVPRLLGETQTASQTASQAVQSDWTDTADTVAGAFVSSADTASQAVQEIATATEGALEATATATETFFSASASGVSASVSEIRAQIRALGVASAHMPSFPAMQETMAGGGLALSNEVVGPGEYVMPVESTRQPGVLETLEAIREGGGAGGQAAAVNVAAPAVSTGSPNIQVVVEIDMDTLESKVKRVVQTGLDDREIDVPEGALVEG